MAGDNLSLGVTLFALGVAAIWFGGSRLPETGKSLAGRWGVSATSLGLFVLSVITSLPELTVTFWAMGENTPDLALGNILGSNNFNITSLVALEFVSAGVLLHRVSRVRYGKTCTLLVLMTAVVGVGVLAGRLIRQPALSVLAFGVPLIGLFIYDALADRAVLRRAQPPERESAPTRSSTRSSRLLWMFLGYAALVVLGGFLTTRGANVIALHHFERAGAAFVLGRTFVGTLFVAVATSIPEVSVAYSSLRRAGSADMALGTLLGSNSINILVFVVGTPILLLRFSESAWGAVSPANLVSVFGAIVLTTLVALGLGARRLRRGALVSRLSTFAMLPVYLLCVFLVYRLA